MGRVVDLEIAVQDADGARIALAEGADRVELCSALGVTGGLTPSAGLLEAVVATGVGVHALIRHRPGGFVYSDAEVDVLEYDVAAAIRAGAQGVVIGALTPDASVDVAVLDRLVRSARAAEQTVGRRVDVTFHRALDAAADPVAAVAVLAELGVDRVLTSGGAARAGDGLAVLEALVDAGTGVQIMAGGGVDVASIPDVLAVGVDAVHLSAKTAVPDPGSSGPGGGTSATLERTDPELVRAARRAVDAVSRG